MWTEKDEHDAGSVSTQTCYQTYRFGDTTSEGVSDRDVKYRHGGSFDRSLDDADEMSESAEENKNNVREEETRADGGAKKKGDVAGAGGGGTEGSSSGASASGAEAGGGRGRGRRCPLRMEKIA